MAATTDDAVTAAAAVLTDCGVPDAGGIALLVVHAAAPALRRAWAEECGQWVNTPPPTLAALSPTTRGISLTAIAAATPAATPVPATAPAPRHMARIARLGRWRWLVDAPHRRVIWGRRRAQRRMRRALAVAMAVETLTSDDVEVAR